MQSYIVRNSEGIYALYSEGSTIYQRTLTGEGWGKAYVMAENAKNSFSLMRCPKGQPVVLFSDAKGNLMLASENKPHKMVLRNESGDPQPLHINSILRENTIQLFYRKSHIADSYITEQHRRDDGSWSKAQIVDKYISEDNMTKLVNIEDNYILFYSKNVPEQQLGYREIGRYGMGDFKLMYATGHKIIDYSLAITSDEIHMCIAVSANRLNRSRLIYVRKDKNGISSGRVVYEGIIKGCHIYVENSKIMIIFSALNGSNRVVSYNMGNSFNRAEVTDKAEFNKAFFVDYNKQSTDSFSASEILFKGGFPYGIKYCPFLKEDNEIEKLKKEIERLKNINPRS